jgi:WD40 repeat protein
MSVFEPLNQKPAQNATAENGVVDLADTECPYKGLAPFLAQDYAYFFGRERDARGVAASTIARSIVVLCGPSGVGKSSVVGAALPPGLAALSPKVRIVFHSRWDRGFYGSLLKREETPTLEALAEEAGREGAPVVFIFDQFEQYFVNHPHRGDEDFEIDMARVVNRRDLDAHVMISLREDALFGLNRLQTRLPQILATTLRLDYLDIPSARRAIRKPLDVFNRHHPDATMRIEDSLVEEILKRVKIGSVRFEDVKHFDGDGAADEGEERVETPYLQLALTRLWHEERRLGSNMLRLETFRRLGYASGIARSHFRDTMDKLAPADQRTCARIFYHMATPSGMKVALTADTLSEWSGENLDDVQRILDGLTQGYSRIVRRLPAPHNPDEFLYEIFHDVLVQPILRWARGYRAEEEKRQKDEELKQEQARSALYRRVMIFGGIGASCIILGFIGTFLAYANWRNTQIAESRIVAMRAEDALERGDSTSAIREVLRGLPDPDPDLLNAMLPERPYVPETAQILERALYYQPFEHVLEADDAQDDSARQVAFSGGGSGERLIATAEAGVARIWNAETGALVATLTHGDEQVTSAAFSGNRRLATMTNRGTVRIWTLDPGLHARETPLIIAEPDVSENAAGRRAAGGRPYVSFDDAGRHLLTVSDAGVRVWDVGDRHLAPNCSLPHTRAIFAAFDPVGKRIVSTSLDGTARIWDITTACRWPEILGIGAIDTHRIDDTWDAWMRDISSWSQLDIQPALVLEHAGPVYAAAFSPLDTNRLVTTSDGNTIQIWNITDDGRPMLTRRVEAERASQSIYGPVPARLRDDGRSHLLRTLKGHTDTVTSVAYDRSGTRILSASKDGTVRLWDDALGDLIGVVHSPEGEEGWIPMAAFSAEEDQVAASFWNGPAYIWRLDTLNQPTLMMRHSGRVTKMAISPDDRVVATAFDQTIRLWGVNGNRDLERPAGLGGRAVMDIQFSPDGRHLAEASGVYEDGTHALIWDMDRPGNGAPSVPKRLKVPPPETKTGGLVLSVNYDPKGERIVTASQDGTVRVWSTSEQTPVSRLCCRHEEAVFSAAFSNDGDRIVTASADGTVVVWDAERGDRPLLTIDLGTPVMSAAFTPGDALIQTVQFNPDDGSAMTTTAFWDARTGRPRWTTLRRDGRLGTDNAGAGSEARGDRLASATISGDGAWLLATSTAGASVIAPTDGNTGSKLDKPGRKVDFAELDSNARHVIVGFEDGTVVIADTATLEDTVELSGHAGRISWVRAASCGRKLFTASRTGTVMMWDTPPADVLDQIRLAKNRVDGNGAARAAPADAGATGGAATEQDQSSPPPAALTAICTD